MSIYNDILNAGIEHDNHESDLYVPDTPETREILANNGIKVGWCAQPFISQIDGKRWLDIPFAYLPYWETKPGL